MLRWKKALKSFWHAFLKKRKIEGVACFLVINRMPDRMETLKKRLNGLQTTYSDMVDGIKMLEEDIISCQEFEVLLKKRIESAKGEADMCKQEIEMRKDVIKNLPILMAEVTKEMEKISKASNFTEDDAILYDDWDERIV